MHRPDDRAELVKAGRDRIGGRAELVERELPAVAPALDVALDDAERRVHQVALELVPAAQRGDVREPARGQEAQHLELGVVAGLQAAEGLQHQRGVEHERRVGLLGAHGAHVAPAGRALHLVGPVERDAGRGALGARLVAEQPRDRGGRARVAQGVDHRHAVDVGDRRRPRAGRVQRQGELVDLVGARREARLDAADDDRHAVLAHGQRHRLDDVDAGDVAALGGEPSLLQQPRAQHVLGQRAQVAADQVGSGHRLAPSSLVVSPSSSVSRNQNQPRGASVSR
jgi:hypothetical protein